jgi:hypothetical protein
MLRQSFCRHINMKQAVKILSLICLLIFSLQVNASNLFLRFYDNSVFTVIFNQSVSSYGCRNFQVNNLMPGTYPIEVYKQCPTSNTPCTFLIYTGMVTVPAASQILAYIDINNQLQAGGIIPYTSSFGYSTGQIDRFSYQSVSTPWFNLNDSTGYKKALAILVQTSNQKLNIIFLKHCIYFYGITSENLSKLMLTLDFDDDRLDLAVYAFGFVTDKENFFQVYDSFIFHGTKQELTNSLYYSLPGSY